MKKDRVLKIFFSFFLLLITCDFSIVYAQGKQNEIDQKRKSIVHIKNTLVKLHDYLYAILSDGEAGNMAVYISDIGVIIVDDQWIELTNNIKEMIDSITNKPITHVINTHYHYDHVDGNKVFGKEGCVIISHDNVRSRLSENQILTFLNYTQEAYPFEGLPSITYSENLTIHKKYEIIQISHLKNAHTDGDSFVEFINANVIHTGDVFVRYGFPFIDGNNGGNIYGMIDAINKLIEHSNDSTRIIPGHGPISYRKDLCNYKDMLVIVEERIRNGIQNNLSIEEIEAKEPLKGFDFLTDYFFNLEQIYMMVKRNLESQNKLN